MKSIVVDKLSLGTSPSKKQIIYAWMDAIREDDIAAAEYLLSFKVLDYDDLATSGPQGSLNLLGLDHVPIFQLLVNDPEIGPKIKFDEVIMSCIQWNQLDALKYIFSLGAALPKDALVEAACQDPHYIFGNLETDDNIRYEVLKLILSHPQCDYTVGNYEAMRSAILKRRDSVVKILLEGREYPQEILNEMLKLAAQYDAFASFKELLEDGRADPAMEDSILFRIILDRAAMAPSFDSSEARDRFEIFEDLLKNLKTNPAARQNEAVRLAVTFADFRYIKALLADNRVDPSDKEDAALKVAPPTSPYMVNLLLEDRRVDYNAISEELLEILGFDMDLLKQASTPTMMLDINEGEEGISMEDIIAARIRESGESYSKVYIQRSKGQPWHDNMLNSLAKLIWPDISDELMKTAHEILDNPMDKNELYKKMVKEGNVDMVKLLIDHPVVRPEGKPYVCSYKHPLAVASWNNYPDIVELILDHPSPQMDSVLHIAFGSACGQGSLEAVQVLLDRTNIDPIQGMKNAAYNGHLPIVMSIMNSPKLAPNADLKDVAIDASKGGHLPVVERLLQDNRTSGVDEQILCTEHEDVLRYLLESFKPVSMNLVHACKKGYKRTVEILLEDGRADPNLVEISYEARKHPEILALLLKDPRVDPHLRDSLVFNRAIEYNYQESVRVHLSSPRVKLEDVDIHLLFNMGFDPVLLRQMNSKDLLPELQPEQDESMERTIARYIEHFALEERYEVYLLRSSNQPWHKDCFKEFLILKLHMNPLGMYTDTVVTNFYRLWSEDKIPIWKLANAYYHLFSGLTKSGTELADRHGIDVLLSLIPYYLEGLSTESPFGKYQSLQPLF